MPCSRLRTAAAAGSGGTRLCGFGRLTKRCAFPKRTHISGMKHVKQVPGASARFTKPPLDPTGVSPGTTGRGAIHAPKKRERKRDGEHIQCEKAAEAPDETYGAAHRGEGGNPRTVCSPLQRKKSRLVKLMHATR